MALSATIYNFDVSISNVDRAVYTDIKLQLACHPSESLPYLLTRLLAFCIEYEEGISFSRGLSESEEPAIWKHDLMGQLTLWIEVGSPSALRLHKASKLGARVVVYAHKDPVLLVSQLAREKIHDAEKIKIYGFSTNFLNELCTAIDRRAKLAVSVSEGQLYVNLCGKNFESVLTEYSIVDS